MLLRFWSISSWFKPPCFQIFENYCNIIPFWVLVIWWFKLCKFIVFVVTHLLVQLKCYILADLKDLTRSWEKNYSFSDARSLCCVYMVLSTTIYKIYETNSSFHVKWHGKVLISIFQQFFATINNNFILGVGLGTRL